MFELGSALKPEALSIHQVVQAVLRGYDPATSKVTLQDGRVVACDGQGLIRWESYPTLHVSEGPRAMLGGDLVASFAFLGACVVAVVGVEGQRVKVRDAKTAFCDGNGMRLELGKVGPTTLIVLVEDGTGPADFGQRPAGPTRAGVDDVFAYDGSALRWIGRIPVRLVLYAADGSLDHTPLEQTLHMTSQLRFTDDGIVVEESWEEGRPGRKPGAKERTRLYVLTGDKLVPRDTKTPFRLE